MSADAPREVDPSDLPSRESRSPPSAEAFARLGAELLLGRRIDEAVDALRQAVALEPTSAAHHRQLALALRSRGQWDEALAHYRRSLSIAPDPAAHCELVSLMNFDEQSGAAQIAGELSEWNRLYAQPLVDRIQPHPNERSPTRRLRIGYVSPDLRQHVVGTCLLPLLGAHDRAAVEVFCYASVKEPDAMTKKLMRAADRWRDIFPLVDARAAEVIRRDQIDVLIDLSLHMPGNRLLIFARKPAPVQMTYLGYAGSTGLAAIDYRISDGLLDPPSAPNPPWVEKTLRLGGCYWAYEPPGELPKLEEPAFERNGQITFGCLNSFMKVSSGALDAWAEILGGVEGSHLHLHCPSRVMQGEVIDRFARAGIAEHRLRFLPHQPWLKYMESYRSIDIALDTFPYAGGITSCDALAMGVAMVTLAGGSAVGRGGATILHQLNLDEWAAPTREQYIRLAVELSRDRARLRELHHTLRPRLQASPLMDAARLARELESAYREAWRAWLR